MTSDRTKPPYTVAFDDVHRTLHLMIAGFWTSATLTDFAATLLAKVTAIRLQHAHFAVMIDSSAFPVQSTEIANGLKTIMTRAAQMNRGPVAILVASSLNKLQAEMYLEGPRLRVFLDRGEAETWLDMERHQLP